MAGAKGNDKIAPLGGRVSQSDRARPMDLPEGVERPQNFAGRLLDRGTFALQAHDPGSEVWYKQIEVRPLPE